jgi:hypothetical protein
MVGFCEDADEPLVCGKTRALLPVTINCEEISCIMEKY